MCIERSDDVNKPSKRATLALAIMPEGYSHRQVGDRIFGRGRTGPQTQNGFAFAVAPFPCLR
jgi:hypothetical protein